ncbi:hypothetical protein DX933_08160 [Ornithinibacillus gellani]|uniref:cell wall-active antibiotics response protein LiaF n=1 Tax=Ornithinibacillus gellani TaxID=2293253 RepID=UPI000F48E0AE|nr:cell wall-active antibiotics response protein LiaF [Ornithinibacillus gellani]TQS74747.1 hypothetical protein DX933_08160 [Ornithinibacillus gellani]
MLNRLRTDTLNWILIIGVVLFIVEIVFFHGGMIVSALIFGVLIYIGWKNFKELWGKICFWIGIAGVFFAVLNMLAVRFFVIAVVVLFIIDYHRSKKDPTFSAPILKSEPVVDSESVQRIKPLFHHGLFEDQQTKDGAFAWRDINIHGAFGDRIIDLSNTVLPDDTAVISIRHIIGNIIIYIPYEVEVSIHHSSLFGRANILGETQQSLLNETMIYHTAHYQDNYPRVKIITTLISGDIEVRRI